MALKDCIVVKLGGSHAGSSLLPDWLRVLGDAAGRVVIVPGGGPFAETARRVQPEIGFDDKAAHEIALLGMTQFGVALASLARNFVLAESIHAIERALAGQRVPVWSPWPMLRDAPDIAASWDVTSDSLALWLAVAIAAPEVLLVKRSAAAGRTTAAQLSGEGLVDAAFPTFFAAFRGNVVIAGPEDMPLTLDPARLPGQRVAR